MAVGLGMRSPVIIWLGVTISRQPEQSRLIRSKRLWVQRRAAPMPRVSDTVSDRVWRVTLGEGVEPSALLSTLVGAGARIDRFEPTLAPMEDIFLRVVGEGRQ